LNKVSYLLIFSSKVSFTVQATDPTKRLSKQRTVDIVNKQHDDEIRRSIKRSNLIRQQEFKKIKKNQKKTGTTLPSFYMFLYNSI
jgi:hypothetical protein